MAERRIINGYIVERGDDGQIRTIGPANAPEPQMPANPTFQYEGPKAATDLRGSELDNQYKQTQINEFNQGRLPTGYRRTADGGAELIPGVPGPKDPNSPALTAAERANAIAGYQSALALDKVIAQLEQQYRAGPGSTSGLGGVADYLPFTENQRFDSTGNAARGTVGQALGFTGGQLNSVQEAEMSVGPYLPQSSDKDSVILDKIGRLKQVRDDARARSIAMLGGIPDVNGVVTPVKQAATVLPRAAGARSDPGLGSTDVTSEGGLRYEQGLARLPDAVSNMVAEGAQPSEITAFLNQQYAPFGASVGPDMAAAIGTLVQRHRADPRAPVKSLSSGWQNFAMLPGQQESTLMGRAADSDVGNFAMHAANAATAGVPGYLAGEQGAAVLDASSQSRPVSSLAGDITGSTAALIGINSGAGSLGRAGALLTRSGGIGGDVAYGATRGAFENGPTGAVTGALAAGIGNKVGGGIANATGRTIRGVSDPAVNYLAERGVPMSLGSLLGNRSIPGRVLNRLESAPVVGDMFAARRADAIEGFNRQAFNEAIAPLGGNITRPGREGMGQALDVIDEGYRNALGDTAISTADPGFGDAIAASRSRMAGIPTIGDELSYNFDNNVAPLFEGGLDGERLQAALRSLREMQSSYAGQPMGQAARDAVGDAEGALRGLVSAQRPEVLPKLSAANEAYRNVSTLADAVNGAANNKGIFTPAQLGRSAVNNTKKFGGRTKAAKGDVPFARLQEAGQEALPSSYPDSGTAGRLLTSMLPTTLGGGAVAAGTLIDPKVAAPLAALALLSSKTGSKVAQKALTGRGPTARAVGDKIFQQRRKAGLFGAAAGVSMLPQFSQ